MTNLVLVCPRHHTDVHTGAWQINAEGHGQIMVTPPRYVDPRQTPRLPMTHIIDAVLHRVAVALASCDAPPTVAHVR